MATKSNRNYWFLSFVAVFAVCHHPAQLVKILGAAAASNSEAPPTDRQPLVIAHRGSSGVLPEHTIAAYQRAIDDGADYIECDVTLTKDHVPVCLHDNFLSETTDVENRTEFASRRRNMTLPSTTGEQTSVSDWFAVDFTLAELKTLRTRQRFEFRDQSQNGKYPIATLQEHLELAGNFKVGTYPEVKDPQWINSLDFMGNRTFEDIVLETLSRHGCRERSDPCIIQSFSEESLIYLANRTSVRLVLLLEDEAPTEAKFTEWSRLGFYGIGPWLNLITNVWTTANEYKNWINHTTDIVAQSHRYGLVVHAFTFRNEDRYLPWDFGQDINNAYDYYIRVQKVDGFFTDFPETLSKFRNDSIAMTCDQVSSATVKSPHSLTSLPKCFTYLFAVAVVSRSAATVFP